MAWIRRLGLERGDYGMGRLESIASRLALSARHGSRAYEAWKRANAVTICEMTGTIMMGVT